MPDKLDLKKELKHLYNPSKKEVSVVDIPKMSYLMIDGMGNPNTSERFKLAMESLYGLCYTVKFASKERGFDFAVMPPEALWWADDMNSFLERDKDSWKWTVMILQPDFITDEIINEAKETVRKKKNPELLDDVRFEELHEGTSAQIMHIGSYDSETENIARIHKKIEELGCKPFGKHHEIYLSDVRRVSPDKLKTVVRQPFRPAK
ncbi:MAG TPA: GyrI-like domain-containing protein [Caldisericia bacterium]|nr:GyrI-like domain-containing protein [Caldisericia bacterium]HPF49332.1 GyrI-like domain-containing protein [Caldisericia bacterium]HPI83988.1 GyrI-like domain-containing protein [Caldisericia bacterium]HPQ93246.1 GyrI-like domain-containing protein [Caldisericia bacterium]HRV75372.1 GyrI-like domain-containing protein [Caldisericia bacterium]